MSETRTIPVTDTNPHECAADHDCEHHEGSHQHGPECGHKAVQHGDHVDYVVGGHLHHPHGDHCDHHGPADSAY